jgi:alpha-1,3/alpha-1,6-mannosyltransferase
LLSTLPWDCKIEATVSPSTHPIVTHAIASMKPGMVSQTAISIALKSLTYPGTLTIRVSGNSVVPRNIFGRFSILCAILRQLHLTLSLLVSGELANYDCLFIDQLSACIPLFRFFAPHIRVLFYCHFPDYMLAPRTSLVKSLYRIPFDWIEAFTTGMADTIVVNSNFTKSVFATAFPKIGLEPRVVYPCVDVTEKKTEKKSIILDEAPTFLAEDGRKILLSINRFERKKNIGLAIKAFARLTDSERRRSRLIIAGMPTLLCHARTPCSNYIASY